MTSRPAAPPEREYVLGTHDEELARLGFQHQIWRAKACDLWERAGFLPGHRLLDVGCGPGYTTLDLAQWVGPGGAVHAVDISERFIAHLKREAEVRGLAQIHARVADLQTLELPAGSCDGAYTRWVLCFVPDPGAVIARVARALRSGGVFAIQDYYNYEALTLAPKSDAFRKVISAVAASWRQHGGDPDIGTRLPALLRQHGLTLREVRPLVRSATPNEMLWQWPTTFFRVFVPSLVKMGFLTPADQAAFDADWSAHTRDPAAFFVTPPMLDLLAVKP